MDSYSFDIFADYNQVVFHDESVNNDFSEIWDDEAYKKMIAVEAGYIALSTARSMDVPVEVLVYEKEPDVEDSAWDHVVQSGIDLVSGKLAVRGVSDYLPDVNKIQLKPGYYAALVLYGGLNTLSEDGLDGDDRYKIMLWPSHAAVELKVLKDSGFSN